MIDWISTLNAYTDRALQGKMRQFLMHMALKDTIFKSKIFVAFLTMLHVMFKLNLSVAITTTIESTKVKTITIAIIIVIINVGAKNNDNGSNNSKNNLNNMSSMIAVIRRITI